MDLPLFRSKYSIMGGEFSCQNNAYYKKHRALLNVLAPLKVITMFYKWVSYTFMD